MFFIYLRIATLPNVGDRKFYQSVLNLVVNAVMACLILIYFSGTPGLFILIDVLY